MQVSGAGIVLDWMDCASWVDGVEYRLGARIPPREPFQRLLAGGIAGAFSRTGACPYHRAVKLFPLGGPASRVQVEEYAIAHIHCRAKSAKE